MTSDSEARWSWLLVILLTVFAVAPLTYPGFFQGQSGFWPVFRVAHLDNAVYWAQAGGSMHGEGRLPYWLVWPLWRISGNAVAAVKGGYALTFLLGALGTLAWSRRWLGIKGGVVSALVYTYLPWHLSTVYERGAYGEAWLWALWPFILWAVDGWATGCRWWMGLAGLLPVLALPWTQPGLAFLSLPVLAVYGAWVPVGRRHPWIWAGGALFGSLVLLGSAARWLPGPRLAMNAGWLYPYQLFSAAWGDGPSFQLGLAAVGLGLITAILWMMGGAAETRRALEAGQGSRLGRSFWFWLIGLLLVLFLVLPLSAPLGRIAGLDAFLTYPWQLLALAGLPLAFLAGMAVRLEERLRTSPVWEGIVALVILSSYPYLAPRFTQVDPGPEPVALFQPVHSGAASIALLTEEVQPPDTSLAITPMLTFTLTWQTVEPIPDDYTVFVHLLANGEKIAQADRRPCNGECPTQSWRPGEIIVDRHQLGWGPEMPAGPYQLAIGLYLLDSGQRARVVGRQEGAVLLDVP